jgi:hypothetical protein
MGRKTISREEFIEHRKKNRDMDDPRIFPEWMRTKADWLRWRLCRSIYSEIVSKEELKWY